MFRPFVKRAGRLWQCYLDQLERRPVLTKCWMSGAILGCADITAQSLKTQLHDEPETGEPMLLSNSAAHEHSFDWRRAGAVQMYAWCFQGPFGHWYRSDPQPHALSFE